MSGAERSTRLPGESLKAYHRRCALEAASARRDALAAVRRTARQGVRAAYASADRAARAVDEDRERGPDSSEPDELPGF